ncbi:MAG: LytTR family DNA-binding domain-containing protein [Oscillospiraceae bacterium]
MRIAVCDDDISTLTDTMALLNEYIQSRAITADCTAFDSAIDLVDSIQSGTSYQLILLDVIMPLLNGMDAAKEIREYDSDTKLIFMTSSPEYAVESYGVDAYYYALKPIWKDKLFLLLDKVRNEMSKHTEDSLVVRSRHKIVRVLLKNLEFVEVMNKTILYHMTDGTLLESSGTMAEVSKILLEYSQFARSHRSFLVNLEHINSITIKELRMSSLATVPVAKSCYSTLKEEYIRYSFSKKEN